MVVGVSAGWCWSRLRGCGWDPRGLGDGEPGAVDVRVGVGGRQGVWPSVWVYVTGSQGVWVSAWVWVGVVVRVGVGGGEPGSVDVRVDVG